MCRIQCTDMGLGNSCLIETENKPLFGFHIEWMSEKIHPAFKGTPAEGLPTYNFSLPSCTP